MSTLGFRLREIRLLAEDLSLRELAALAEVSATYPSLIESGARPNVGADKLGRIAKVLGTTIDHLLTGSGPAPSAKRVKSAVAAARAALAESPPARSTESPPEAAAKAAAKAAPKLLPAETDEQTPAEAPAPKRLSSRPPPPSLALPDGEFQAKSRASFNRVQLTDATDIDDETTSRDAAVAGVKLSERDRTPTEPDDRGAVLEPTPKPLTALDVDVRERVYEPDEDERTPIPNPDGGL